MFYACHCVVFWLVSKRQETALGIRAPYCTSATQKYRSDLCVLRACQDTSPPAMFKGAVPAALLTLQ